MAQSDDWTIGVTLSVPGAISVVAEGIADAFPVLRRMSGKTWGMVWSFGTGAMCRLCKMRLG
ncbi:MAG TPA: hypothetical protein DD465_07465 [Thalassospira sp.]|nr:hypothetical protein [Thalassospira sp.]